MSPGRPGAVPIVRRSVMREEGASVILIFRARDGAAMANGCWYLGIDPGLHGALALVPSDAALDHVVVRDTPIVKVKTGITLRNQYAPGDMRGVLCELVSIATMTDSPNPARVLVVLEHVHPHPGEGVRSVGSLMRGSGLWEGIAVGLGLPVRLVAPQAWKRHAGLLKTKKGASRIVASTTFPTVELGSKAQTGRADALLIAAYGRSQNF